MLDCRRIVRPLFNDVAGVEEVISSGELTLKASKDSKETWGRLEHVALGVYVWRLFNTVDLLETLQSPKCMSCLGAAVSEPGCRKNMLPTDL